MRDNPLPAREEAGESGETLSSPGTYKLLSYYSLISLIAMVGMAVLLNLLFGKTEQRFMLDLGEKQNIALTQAFSNALWPSLESLLRQSSELLVEDLQGHPLIAHIRQLLNRFTQQLDIVTIEIYNRSGVTIFSTEAQQIGTRRGKDTGFLHAMEDRVFSERTHRGHIAAASGERGERELLSSYVPIRQKGEIVGVFKLDYDIGPLLVHRTHATQQVLQEVGGVFVALYVMLFFVVRRGSVIIREQQARLTRYLQEIRHSEESLKDRVEERTETLRLTNDLLKEEILERQQAEAELRKLSRAVEQSPASVIITDLQGQVQYVNPKFCQVTGYAEEEIIGQNTRILKSGEIDAGGYQQMWERLKQGEEWQGEFHNRRKDGTLFWELASISPIRDQYGRITHYIAVKEDITELKTTVDSLRHSEARLRTIMDNVVEAILAINQAGIIESANPGVERLFGTPPEAVLGGHYESLLPPHHTGEDIHHFLQQGAGRDGCLQREVMALRQDGSLFPVELTVSTVQTAGSVPFIVTIRDISERKKNEEELAKAQQMSYHQEKMASIGTLAAGILHEINNPTAAISGILEALMDLHVNPDPLVADYLQMMREQLERITGITREVSEFSMPQIDEMQLLDLNSLVEKCANLMRFDQRMRNVRLRLQLDRTLPALYGSSAQLNQVIINLLLNAADALEGQQDPLPTVSLTTRAEPQAVLLEVMDNGSGMDDKTKSQAFDAFFTTKPVGKGTGLGLAVCYSLVAKHKGRIELLSTVGEGSTFTLFLPLAARVNERSDDQWPEL
ncbi:MAG: PAS domain S-box protein [Magnetococcales bacterium]|nr:PAS domain S-box protein [Magnetococcales bacterium]